MSDEFLNGRVSYSDPASDLGSAMIATVATKRQRIDTMTDAHVWIRRQARLHGEWPTPPDALQEQRRMTAAVKDPGRER